jgi:hypothetical protein
LVRQLSKTESTAVAQAMATTIRAILCLLALDEADVLTVLNDTNQYVVWAAQKLSKCEVHNFLLPSPANRIPSRPKWTTTVVSDFSRLPNVDLASKVCALLDTTALCKGGADQERFFTTLPDCTVVLTTVPVHPIPDGWFKSAELTEAVLSAQSGMETLYVFRRTDKLYESRRTRWLRLHPDPDTNRASPWTETPPAIRPSPQMEPLVAKEL